MEEYTNEQQLLNRIRAELCDGSISVLARRIGKDVSYVSRLLYPVDNKGRKGVGLEIMKVCNKAFDLPLGFWEQSAAEVVFQTHADAAGSMVQIPAIDSVLIRQFQPDSVPGMTLLLEGQPGVIKSWQVSQSWLQQNVRGAHPQKLCLLTGFGMAMHPLFHPGDPLLVDQGVTAVEKEGVYFFHVDGQGYIRLLQRIPKPGGGYFLRVKAKNPDYDAFDLDEKTMSFQILGRVLMVWRGEAL